MRLLIFILFLLIPLMSFSQTEPDSLAQKRAVENMKLAGEDFQKFHEQRMTGFWISLGGAALTTIGILTHQNKKKGDDRPAILTGLGGATTLTGSIIMLSSSAHVKKGGKKLEKAAVGLKMNFNF